MNLTGEERFRQTPDASRQRRSTPGGINAATTDSSACNKQPTPQFSTAGENYQGKKIEKIEHNNLQQPVDGSSPKSNEEAYDTEEGLGFGTRAPDGPQPSLQATSPIEEDRAASREAGDPGDPATVPDLAPIERTPTPDITHPLGRRLTLRK